MSLNPRPTSGGDPNPNYEPQQKHHPPHHHPDIEATPTSSSTSSSWRKDTHSNNTNTSSSHLKSKIEESDEDLFTVPDVETALIPDTPLINNNNTTNSNIHNNVSELHPAGKRRRGRNPVDKEYRKLKRLLRNRVSAQQARERKKVYVNELELRAEQLQDSNSKLEEKISTMINENTMLRKVLMNTRPKNDENIEPKQDQMGKSSLSACQLKD